MKNIFFLLLIGCVFACSPKKEIRVALISGMNPKFNHELYDPLLNSVEGATWQVYNNAESQELFKPENSDQYDIIMFYDICLEEFPDPARQRLADVVRGGKSVLIHHDGLLTYNTWPEFAKIAGMKYFMSEQDVDGVKHPVSRYRHNVDIPVKVTDKDHFITKGMDETFVLHDEIYGRMWHSPDIHPLWTTGNPDSDPVVMYTHQYGKGKVVGIVPGHGPEMFKDQHYQTAFARAVYWLAK
ncbi:MAG: ThuA domain-containing protein [Bacteroidales bacterium]|jgi:type 1 glutamine amidotransferase|nr:ThuA domain-containing protein [Bacteroidales bacterium]